VAHLHAPSSHARAPTDCGYDRGMRRSALASVLVVFAASCGGDADSPSDDARDAGLAAVIKGLDNPFFETMRDGLVATARRYDVPLGFAAAAGIQDPAGQGFRLESLVDDGAGCYVVNPINPTNLIQALAHAPEGTPIINVDSPVDRDAAQAVGVQVTAYIGTDNVAAGRAGADAMAGLVDRGARVAVVAGIPGDVGSGSRTRGFREGAAGRFELADTIAADFDRNQGRLAGEELLRTYPALQGIFAVNDEMALGIAAAVGAAGKRGDVAVIGMDGTREALTAIDRGAMSATVAQYPYAMGQLAVEACLARVRGEAVPDRIDAPVQIVTKENVSRARANFPQPVDPFDDSLAELLKD